MPNDWVAKSCLFAQVMLGCVCVCVCVCVVCVCVGICVCVCGIFGKNSTWDYRITEAKDLCLSHKEQIPKDTDHPYSSHTHPPFSHMLNLFQIDSGASVCPQSFLSPE